MARWTKARAERYATLESRLMEHGFTRQEVDALLRCERVLQTWAEHECNGEIQRDETSQIPYWYNMHTGNKCGRTADRETGALRRAKTICERHGCTLYHQGDPRGCVLWVIRPGDVRQGADVGSCYTNGVAICVD